MILPEHTTAILTRDLPERGLRAGDAGTIISIYHDPADDARAAGYLLEMFTAEGETADVVDVPGDAVRDTQDTIPPFASDDQHTDIGQQPR